MHRLGNVPAICSVSRLGAAVSNAHNSWQRLKNEAEYASGFTGAFMGMLSWLRSKIAPEPLDASFTAEEAELAPQIAEAAGTLMGLQLSTASRYAMARGHDLKDFTWEIQAFAFGLFCSALEQKGISWYKGAPVLLRYCESYMPDYADHKELAQLVSHFGNEPEYESYVSSGRAAMLRFANNQINEQTDADISDLAIALGLDREPVPPRGAV